jgi:hypothetical protein
MTKEQVFNLVCFIVLMENNTGVQGKSADYIAEKFTYARRTCLLPALDHINKELVLMWADKWLGEGEGERLLEQVTHEQMNIPAEEYHNKYKL